VKRNRNVYIRYTVQNFSHPDFGDVVQEEVQVTAYVDRVT
jgi:hypothetical protein